jgi:hypothetical protein
MMLTVSIGVMLAASATAVQAESGVGMRAGSMGFGADFNIGLAKRVNARLGYNFFNYGTSLDDTGVHYDTTIKISSLSGLLDWHVADNGFRFTAGMVSSGPRVKALGTPSAGNYSIGDGVYAASQIGSIEGELKAGKSLAPYVGVGYGRIAGNKRHLTFLADVGAIHTGTVDVSLSATCGASLPAALCTQLQNDVQAEIGEIRNNAGSASWYPVISLGMGYRF